MKKGGLGKTKVSPPKISTSSRNADGLHEDIWSSARGLFLTASRPVLSAFYYNSISFWTMTDMVESALPSCADPVLRTYAAPYPSRAVLVDRNAVIAVFSWLPGSSLKRDNRGMSNCVSSTIHCILYEIKTTIDHSIEKTKTQKHSI